MTKKFSKFPEKNNNRHLKGQKSYQNTNLVFGEADSPLLDEIHIDAIDSGHSKVLTGMGVVIILLLILMQILHNNNNSNNSNNSNSNNNNKGLTLPSSSTTTSFAPRILYSRHVILLQGHKAGSFSSFCSISTTSLITGR